MPYRPPLVRSARLLHPISRRFSRQALLHARLLGLRLTTQTSTIIAIGLVAGTLDALMQMVADILAMARSPLNTFVKVARQERADTGGLFGKDVVDTPLEQEEEEKEGEKHRRRHRRLAKFVAQVATSTPKLVRFAVNGSKNVLVCTRI